jgi:hypothetical protein
MTPYVFQRGETITLALEALSGDVGTVTAITADMKALAPGRTSVSAQDPVAASFAITANSTGWTLTIPAAVSAALLAGSYLADARLVVAGGVIVTEPVSIRIRQAVTS